jgi:hypothetical protein
MLDGTSLIGLPSRKLFALVDQSSVPPQVAHPANALNDKLDMTIATAAIVRIMPIFFVISPHLVIRTWVWLVYVRYIFSFHYLSISDI